MTATQNMQHMVPFTLNEPVYMPGTGETYTLTLFISGINITSAPADLIDCI